MVYGAPGRGQGARPGRTGTSRCTTTFAMDEVLSLEADVEVLHGMCLEAVDHVVTTERFRDFAIPEYAWEGVAASWKRSDPHLYGRFDLRYGGDGPAVLLEYNADTPTTLLEASILQWNWLKDTHADDDQWNSIHEKLVERWGADQVQSSRGRDLLHVVERRHQRRGPRHGRLHPGDRGRGRARHGRARDRGHRLGRRAGPLRRSRRGPDGRGVQALPVGVGAHRRLRQARAAQPPRDAVGGAAVEGDPVQQGAAGRPVGDVPRPPQPAARLPRPARDAHRVRPQAPAGP